MKVEIRVSNLCKSYGGVVIFHDYNCVFYSQKYNCITGPSGVGKTTLLRMLMGLENYDRGEIRGIEGKRFSCVFQENRLLENFTGLENIKIILGKKRDEEEILEGFESVGLYSSRHLPVYTYSGGMKRRLALLRAILAHYDIIVLDEPFKELDEKTYFKCIDYFEEKTRGKSVILSTHNPYEMERFGNHKVDIINNTKTLPIDNEPYNR